MATTTSTQKVPAAPEFSFKTIEKGIAQVMNVIDLRANHRLNSQALADVSWISARLAVQTRGKLTWNDKLNARLLYLECVVTSVARLVYNLVLATVFAGLSCASVGLIDETKYNARKYWSHAGMSGAAVMIAGMGVVFPPLAFIANGSLAANAFFDKRAIVHFGCDLFQENVRPIRHYIEHHHANPEYKEEDLAVFDQLARTLRSEDVHSLEDIRKVVENTRLSEIMSRRR
jgi:hypothetical protein